MQREKGARFLLRAAPWALGFLLFAFALDVVLHFGPVARVALVAAWVLLGLLMLAAAWQLAWLRRNSAEHIARLLEDRYPALGSKLINVLQLEAQAEDPAKAPLTRQMAKLAVDGYARDLGGVDLERLARTDTVRRELRRAGWFMLGFAVLLGGFYQITLAELPRFADPFGDHPPFSFTRLEIVEPATNAAPVVFRQGVGVRAQAAGHRPGELFLTFHPPNHPEKAVTVPMFDKGKFGYFQQIENIQTDLVVFAHTKDRHSLSRKRAITVLLTPKLDKAFVQVAPPAYTGLAPAERTFAFKNERALLGSQVRFRLQSNRPLREGVIELIKEAGEPQRIPMTKSGEHEVTGVLEARDSGRLKFSVVDVDGIASEEAWESSLTVTHDLAPEVTAIAPNKDGFVSVDYRMEAQFEASDDYGLKRFRIHLALNKEPLPPREVNYEKLTRHARETLPLNLPALGAKPGDILTIYAEVMDTAPEPNFARTTPVNLAVISEEDYNQFLRQRTDLSEIEAKYADLLAQFHERIEAQKQLGKDIEALRKKLAAADPKQREALQSDLDRLLARQNEVNQQLNQVAERMENFVRKNPLYDLEAELQHALEEKARQIRESTAQTDARTLDIAQRSAPTPAKRSVTPELLEELKHASDEQLARLEKTEQQAREETVAPLHDLALLHELMKDFNRFEALVQAQQAIAEQAAAFNRTTPLSREDQLALKDLAASERRVAEELTRVEQQLRADAKQAEELFPKAAASARDLAEKMEGMRLEPLASKTTSEMLSGAGAQSYQLAERLRAQMASLCSECNGQGQSQMSSELDTYLRAQRNLKPGNTFKQMLQSQKFGRGNGSSLGFGFGPTGAGGEGGFAVSTAPALDVHGSETFLMQNASASKQSGPPGQGPGKTDAEAATLAFEKPDAVQGVKPVNRQSGAVVSESLIGEYAELVDRYFRALSK